MEIDFLSENALEEAAALEAAASDVRWGRGVLGRDLRDPGLRVYLGARRRGRLEGYAVLERERDAALLANLIVRPEIRRWGVGSQLLLACGEVAQEWGMPRIRLRVRASNEAARGLYERLGFRDAGPGEPYSDGETARVYVASLPLRDDEIP